MVSKEIEKTIKKNTQPRQTPRGRLLEYCVDSRHLTAHRATTSSSRARFKFRLFLGPPLYFPLIRLWVPATVDKLPLRKSCLSSFDARYLKEVKLYERDLDGMYRMSISSRLVPRKLYWVLSVHLTFLWPCIYNCSWRPNLPFITDPHSLTNQTSRVLACAYVQILE
jgi:hypothetical protein